MWWNLSSVLNILPKAAMIRYIYGGHVLPSIGQCLDSKVRERMIAVLSTELARYVQELHVVTAPAQSWANSTAASDKYELGIIAQIQA